ISVRFPLSAWAPKTWSLARAGLLDWKKVSFMGDSGGRGGPRRVYRSHGAGCFATLLGGGRFAALESGRVAALESELLRSSWKAAASPPWKAGCFAALGKRPRCGLGKRAAAQLL